MRPEPVREATKAADRSGIDIPSQPAACVPMIGQIAAGFPVLAEQTIEDIFPLPRQLVGDGTLFLLKVLGDSMIDAVTHAPATMIGSCSRQKAPANWLGGRTSLPHR